MGRNAMRGNERWAVRVMAALPLLACPGFALSAAPTVISGPMPRLATVPSGPVSYTHLTLPTN